jgi:hypothetical protein
MPRALPISNDYPADWPEINMRVVEAVGRRCIRCGHPYVKGNHGKGEWSPCDEKCTHHGPLAFVDAEGAFAAIQNEDMHSRDAQSIASGRLAYGRVCAQWRILTVHHFDGDKANCEWWNLLALCQRCHLTIQSRVNPQQPYMFEHSAWLKPYVAGFYAHKYEGKQLTRDEVMLGLDDLLAHERIA